MSDVSDLFEQAKIKKTKQRIILIHELEKEEIPITAEALHFRLKDMSLSTIYRALELFCEKGIVQKSVINDSDCYYYELTGNQHRHYAVCLGCNEIMHIDMCPLHDVKMDTSQFTVTSHKLELYGYCEKCRNKFKGAKNETD